MNKIIKTRNFSGIQAFQYFSSTKNEKTNDSDKLKLEEIKHIYNFLYNDNFSNILIQSKDIFMNNIELNINNIIRYHFDEMYINTTFFQQTLNKYRKEIEDKYLNDFSILNEQYQMNKNLKEKQRIYLSHFLKHCINTCQYAYHHCMNNRKGKFILVEDKNNKIIKKTPEIKYVICFDCKQCYPSDCIKMICTPCNYEYFSSVLKENEDSNIALATWEKYHCGGTLQDQVMKCIKCKKELYINLTTNKLFCKNCKFESKPNSILWKCYFCSQEFRSKVKVYNPIEFDNMKKAINNALIMKIKANSKILPCCKKDTKGLTFYHKEECKGILYKGFLIGKEILVCKICHAMNFIDKFHWICPLCGKKFHLHHSISVTPYKIIKNNFSRENININNNSGKKSTRRFFLRKDSSSSFHNELEKNKNENEKFLNKTKDENISFNFNSNINSFKNLPQQINNKNDEINEKEKNSIIKIIKIPQKEINNSDSRNCLKNKDIYLEIENDEINHKYKKKKRKTLYEVLEDKKEQANNNMSLKKTIESVLVEKNFNKTKIFNDEKLNIGNNENENNNNLYKLSQTSLLPIQKNNFSNNEIKNSKYYDTKVNNLINDKEKEKEKNINKKNQISKENYTNRNCNYISFMNSSDDLLKQKHLIKCKSYNIFNNDNKNNDNNNSNNNNLNHQTNYVFTTNSNYNIKVTLNINHNICSHPKKDENELNNINNIKKEKENNYKKIYNNVGLNKIKDIYLHEIIKNSKANLEKQLLDNNIDNKINIKNNFIKKRKNIGNLSPQINSNNEYKLVNSTKNENYQKIGYRRRRKELYYNTSNNTQKNSFLNFNKSSDNKKLNKNFNFKVGLNIKNEPKKLIINSKYNIFNNNSASNSNLISPENKAKKRFNINYINVKDNNKNNINNNETNIKNNFNNKEVNSKNKVNNNNEENIKKLKDIEEITKEEELSKNETNLTKLKDVERTNTILYTNKKNIVNDQFKYDLMKNVIVSPEKISQLSKESIIPDYNDKDFRYIRPIGEGAYGLIYLVENIHNRKQFALYSHI